MIKTVGGPPPLGIAAQQNANPERPTRPPMGLYSTCLACGSSTWTLGPSMMGMDAVAREELFASSAAFF